MRRFLEHESEEHQFERIPAVQVRSVALVYVYGNESQFLVERRPTSVDRVVCGST